MFLMRVVVEVLAGVLLVVMKMGLPWVSLMIQMSRMKTYSLLLLIEEVARGGVGFNEDDDGAEQPDELYDECGWVGR